MVAGVRTQTVNFTYMIWGICQGCSLTDNIDAVMAVVTSLRHLHRGCLGVPQARLACMDVLRFKSTAMAFMLLGKAYVSDSTRVGVLLGSFSSRSKLQSLSLCDACTQFWILRYTFWNIHFDHKELLITTLSIKMILVPLVHVVLMSTGTLQTYFSMQHTVSFVYLSCR